MNRPALPGLRIGMVGLGMIFEETYRPLWEHLDLQGLPVPGVGFVPVTLAGVASRTGRRGAGLRNTVLDRDGTMVNAVEPGAMEQLLRTDANVICIATPDDRHFAAAELALRAGRHVLIEKPSVLSLDQLDRLNALARQNGVLAKVTYHKLFDPDHKRLRTLVAQGVLQHVNHGYCSLLEPKSISQGQFAEWIVGRNPATYVAVHYFKLIDFTFFGQGEGQLRYVTAAGQRGLVGPATGTTWDSVQVRMEYAYPDGRTAAFDIHTSWVTPDNFPGYVEQEVQFRFDNAVWNAHQRKRGVEVCVEGRTPTEFKTTPNHHYSTEFLQPWGQYQRRGYGLEAIQRFLEEVAVVEWGGRPEERAARLEVARGLRYNDLQFDRATVATVQAVEHLLSEQADGGPPGVVAINDPAGGMVHFRPGRPAPHVLYTGRV